ncbi:CYTH domain-containing protein [Streptosporangium sp. NPDC002524]|uniref:CYTH domain-containing protein n=1 Tax=Streptosporangium sp. NPDC002524 TaxID=3154537 RepID=UPI00331BEC18
MKHIEVERKYQIEDPAALTALQDALMALDAKPGPISHQVDTYYNAPHRDFLDQEVVSEWLRVRKSNGGSSVNFKLWHPVDAVAKTHADEYESPVADPEASSSPAATLTCCWAATTEPHTDHPAGVGGGRSRGQTRPYARRMVKA